MKTKELQAVIFDMDGVLIDSHPTHQAAWSEFFRSLGRTLSLGELSFILDGRTRVEILRHFLGDLPDRELVQYGRRKDEIFRDMEPQIRAVPGVIHLLERLSHSPIAVAVATSASEIRTLATIERMGLSDRFQAVITASDVASGKPDPMVYRLACQRLGASPSRSLAFDDAPAGVQSAREAGMRCIGVATNGLGQRLLAAGAETVIPDFSRLDLESWIENACYLDNKLPDCTHLSGK